MRNRLAAVIGILGVMAASSLPVSAETQDNVHQQYLQAVNDLQAAGIATTPAEIWPASAPDDQNAAPLYTKLCQHEYDGGQAETDALAVIGASPKDSDWAKARAFIDSNPTLLDLVHKIASMPVCVVPGRADAAEQAALLFPELAAARRVERIIAIESSVMAHDGHAVGAINNAALGFQLANHGYQEPTLIGYLVGVAVDAITVNNIDRIMVLHRGEPAVVAAADAALSTWQPHSLKYSLSGETVMAIAEVGILRAGDLSKLADIAGDGVPPSMKNVVRSPEAFHDFIDANGLVLVNYFKDVVNASSGPYPTSSKALDALDADLAAQHGDNYMLAHILCPVFTKTVSKQAQIESRVDLARVCAAALTYKSAHGIYPGSLDQAMTSVPVDPFDLQPIRYRPDGGGFVVYSVGETGNYAGGTSTSNENVLRVTVDGSVSFK